MKRLGSLVAGVFLAAILLSQIGPVGPGGGGNGGGGGGGGKGTPPYSTTTIGASPFSIPAVTHGQGKYAFVECWDSSGNPQVGENCNVSRNPTTGDLTITYITAPGQVDVFGATGGFANPMTTAGDLIVGGSSPAGGATRLAQGTNGQVLSVQSGTLGYHNPTGTVSIVLPATVGKAACEQATYTGAITAATIAEVSFPAVSSSATVDILVGSYQPTEPGSSIIGSGTKPTLSSQTNASASITGWTTGFTAGQWICGYVNSTTSAVTLNVVLTTQRTN